MGRLPTFFSKLGQVPQAAGYRFSCVNASTVDEEKVAFALIVVLRSAM